MHYAFPLTVAVLATTLSVLPVQAEQAPVVKTSDSFLVNGSAVRMRATPATDAKEITQLAFGTAVKGLQKTTLNATIAGKTAPWYQVQASANQGWVFGGFLAPLKSPPEATWLAIVRPKVKQDSLPLNEAIEVAQFAAQVAPKAKTRSAKGELELANLNATQLALKTIEPSSAAKEPAKSLLKTLGKQAFYDEISGQYLISQDTFWKLADQYKNDPIGDTIAWRAAQQYGGGECEGYIPCVSGRSASMEGEYLKRYPKGKSVKTALAQVNETFDFMIKEWNGDMGDPKEVNLKEWQAILKPLADTPDAAKARKSLQTLLKLKQP